MKQFLLILAISLWPITVQASLVSYDISVTISGENLHENDFLRGEVAVAVHFSQDTNGDPFHQGVKVV